MERYTVSDIYRKGQHRFPSLDHIQPNYIHPAKLHPSNRRSDTSEQDTPLSFTLTPTKIHLFLPYAHPHLARLLRTSSQHVFFNSFWQTYTSPNKNRHIHLPMPVRDHRGATYYPVARLGRRKSFQCCDRGAREGDDSSAGMCE